MLIDESIVYGDTRWWISFYDVVAILDYELLKTTIGNGWFLISDTDYCIVVDVTSICCFDIGI